ncbi:MAG: HlyD family efflux transporter periplasmic adaptor subunit [Chloroflexi bacterium]|nr:HlyD family efflux transporter periplasmic adaptor subunit [Chloroflexota bacterium]
MRFLSAKAGPLYVWQYPVLLAVLVGAGLAAFFYAPERSTTPAGGLAEGEQLVPVQRGTLTDAIATSGTVVFPMREEVSFSVAGEVGEVLVSVGSVVREGDALARLDAATVASFERNVTKAEVDLRDAQEALADALGLPDASEIAAASDAVTLSRRALENAQADLELTVRNSARDEADARDAIDAAMDAVQDALDVVDERAEEYAETFVQWLGVPASSVNTELDPAGVLSGWELDLDALFDDRQVLNHELSWMEPPNDDPATLWDELVVFLWKTLYVGRLAGTCPDGPPFEGRCAEHEMEEAWTAVEDARLPVEEALAVVDDARAALENAEAKTARDLLSAEEAVEKAESALVADEESAADLTVETEALDVALLRREITVAEHALASAQEDLRNAVLTAPVSGIVEDVSMEAGDRPGDQSGQAGQQAASGSITILDPSVVEVDGSVDEIDVLAVSVGMPVAVSLSALEGQTLAGEILEIGAASSGTGVVTFPVTVRLDVPAGLTLRDGLTAVSEIVLAQYAGELLIPTSSVTGSILSPVVRVSVDGVVEERSVTLGPSDDFWVVVLDGLVEGEQVVMPEPAAAAQGGGGFGAIFGGPGRVRRGGGGGG